MTDIAKELREYGRENARRAAARRPQPAAAPGVSWPEAALISAGGRAYDLWRGGVNLLPKTAQDMLGLEHTPQSVFDEEKRLMAPLREQHPVATAIGGAAPDALAFALSGGGATIPSMIVRGATTGGLLGAADPDSSAIEGAGWGAGGAGAGGLLGRGAAKVAGAIGKSPAVRSAYQNVKDVSREAAARIGAKNLSVKELGRVERAISSEYTRALAGRTIPIDATFRREFDFLARQNRVPKAAKDILSDATDAGGLSGEAYQRLFRVLTERGRKDPKVDVLRETLQATAADAIPALGPINQRWAQLRFLQKPHVSRGGKVSLPSLAANLERYNRRELQESSAPLYELVRRYQANPKRFAPGNPVGLRSVLTAGGVGGGSSLLGLDPSTAAMAGLGILGAPYLRTATAGTLALGANPGVQSAAGRIGTTAGGLLAQRNANERRP